ncbi:MAG: acylphosphatase [Chloroflexota bacterium]|nr:acylphosphatase [Chloroflexota bacterium]MDE2941935.1 acylphosphatase [Chloroflexota bacterium]MDE3268628.1 acylphosphatase [Chloroflexota bacterium]
MNSNERLHAIARGKVQGVSFRYFVVRRAQGLGLTGYAYNTPDGRSVEVVAEGERDGLEELLIGVRQGPTGADVQDVDASWSEASGEFRDFRIAYQMPIDGPGNNVSWEPPARS